MKPILALVAAASLLTGCATGPSKAELDAIAAKAIQGSFRDQGIARVDRIAQDLDQSACSAEQPPTDDVAQAITKAAEAGIRWPDGGRYLGDWREGERLAQSGRGMTWTDPSAEARNNGGNCYNCHQIDKKELSFGTIGPSLWNYGKLRGITDVTAPTAAPIVQYTWGKLWNSRATAACSQMPRFGHKQLLNEDQIRHIMALLLDPRSPVNQ